ncbi:hypothetical protein HN419_04700 [Candidatus Woesearchaeota archaeon]|jgi:hypothetical protein|nr:hypothetical protein [Candidatus Woesearchaeota archaeon]MBT3537824.1 hypothetical protein [Candidatus Woesearchaeota archaeon]MBT4697955.1 hypothetical protein [Candidatus Woesearchaeota archaeon]MBT7105493.1 hypothetical protein [Candidatus Woesearchaeota archaeon]MBT7496898.1 hypothetical protein [Candidatus Woesearchaeota archaeon]
MKTIRLEDVDYDHIPALNTNVGIGGLIFVPLEWQKKRVLVLLMEDIQ